MRHPLVRVRVLAIIAAAGLLGAVFSYLGLVRTQADALPVYQPAPAFSLTDQLGRRVSAEEFRGKVVLADFIYTSCWDTCPLLSSRMQELQERLRQAQLLGSHVQLLSVTVDPAHDTVPVLARYAERYQADPDAWRFLTGPEAEVRALIVEGFRLGVVPLPTADPDRSEVMHSNRFVLIDRQGRIRAYYDGTDLDGEQVLSDVRQLAGT